MPENYFSFLLRLWRTGSPEQPTWRVMLEDPHTHEIVGFDGLESFITHLQNLAGGSADPNDQDHVAGGK